MYDNKEAEPKDTNVLCSRCCVQEQNASANQSGSVVWSSGSEREGFSSGLSVRSVRVRLAHGLNVSQHSCTKDVWFEFTASIAEVQAMFRIQIIKEQKTPKCMVLQETCKKATNPCKINIVKSQR